MKNRRNIAIVAVPAINFTKALGVLSRFLDKRFRIAFSYGNAYIPLKADKHLVGPYLDRLSGKFVNIPPSLLPQKRKAISISAIAKNLKIGLPRSINIVGDIITINTIPSEYIALRRVIGDVLRRHLGYRGVFLKRRKTSGTKRIAVWERLAGWGDTFTIHKESGCLFCLDISRVFFNPRLGAERLRILSQVRDGETIIDMFAGVGPFSILLSKYRRVRVYAIDINKYAIHYMTINSTLNKTPIDIIHGDAKEAIYRIHTKADRIIMNYPEGAINFIGYAIEKLRDEGFIHVYMFVDGKNIKLTTRKIIADKIAELGYRPRTVNINTYRVGEVAPYRYLVCADVYVRM